jgi:hypothetical protein
MQKAENPIFVRHFILQLMISAFVQQLLLSVVIAGVWISAATLIAERLGSRTGGMVGNLPSTILVSLLFIGITQSPQFAAEATVSVPLGMTLSTLFLFAFIALLPLGLIPALTGSLATWLLLAVLSSYFQKTGIMTWILVYTLVALASFFLSKYMLRIKPLGRTARKFSPAQMLLRALFAGSVVGGAVLVGQSGSAFWAGIFASFPAMMLSSMVILSLSAGIAFARATGMTMLLASTNIVIYSFCAGYLFPLVGLTIGTIVSYAVSAAWVWLLSKNFFLISRL